MLSDDRYQQSLVVTFAYVLLSVPLEMVFALAVAVVLNQGLKAVAFYRAVYYVPSLLGGSAAIAKAAEVDGAGRVRRFLHVTLPLLSPIVFFNLVLQIIGAFQAFTPAFIVSGGSGGQQLAGAERPDLRLGVVAAALAEPGELPRRLDRAGVAVQRVPAELAADLRSHHRRQRAVLLAGGVRVRPDVVRRPAGAVRVMLGTIMLPQHVTLVAQYSIFRDLDWVDTYLPLVVPKFLGTEAFFIFLMVQFQIYLRIVLPLLRPALVTTAIFSFIWSYNDFFTALIYVSDPPKLTVPLALRTFLDASGQSEWRQMFAMSIVTMVPVLAAFVFFQRRIVEGLATSGLK
ncbi:hypothetical protein [Kribbella sp. NPDC050470]|uniref:ABC transporter permease n=1 Tax=unclassified Kribbella TaxID=2644121 RepID=UPI003790A528